MAGGGGVGQAGMSARGGRGGFLKGSERPEAGCLGELIGITWDSTREVIQGDTRSLNYSFHGAEARRRIW